MIASRLPGEDRSALGADAQRLAVTEWTGSTPRLAFVHATGFCRQVWAPVVAELAAAGRRYGGLAFDQRGHGDSEVTPPPYRLVDSGRDAAALLRGRPGPWIGVGHSSGGTAVTVAELLAPGTFAGLVVIEPIVFPGPHLRHEDNPMTAVASRRRSRFPSRQAALARFLSGPFAGWDRRALDAYVDGCMRADGEGVTLKCDPQVEAEYYREGLAHDTFDRLHEVRCPALVVSGERSTTHPPGFVEDLADRYRHGEAVVLPDAGHLVPMERPRRVAELVACFVGRLLG